MTDEKQIEKKMQTFFEKTNISAKASRLPLALEITKGA